MSSKMIKLALAGALILGTASAALASDSGDYSGGFVMPGSMDGVNPAYHPGIFGNTAAAKAYGFAAPHQARHAPHKHVQGH
jgi:ABC-type sugar transport system substrate-binding protein